MTPQNGRRKLRPAERLVQGYAYTVTRLFGFESTETPAEILQIKSCTSKGILENRKLKYGADAEAPKDSPGKKYKLYYVHYENLDRRHDEWVERDRFVDFLSETGLPATRMDGDGQIKRTITRSVRKFQEEFNHRQPTYLEMNATMALFEKEHEKRTRVKNIEGVHIGGQRLRVWYFSPYPKNVWGDVLYVCEFCLMYTADRERFACHRDHQCKERGPPGKLIYRDGNVLVFEVDGNEHKFYCQCLCLLSKLFMDHKMLFYDPDDFLFYIVCEVSEKGARLAGHFSKERRSGNNLACIMVLPSFQRKGYGKFLIQLSYELSRREGWVGSPERPLSDLGKVSYRSYWWWRIVDMFDSLKTFENKPLEEFARLAGIEPSDFQNTIQTVCNTTCKPNSTIRFTRDYVDQVRERLYARPRLLLKPECLNWTAAEEDQVPWATANSEHY